MEIFQGKPQWALHVIVYHGQGFGHGIWLETQRQGREPIGSSLGTWTGLGIPEDVLELATARLSDTLYEHLLTRYSIRTELPFRRRGSSTNL
jgi:hypothetical protein